jgi:hypothetical protein
MPRYAVWSTGWRRGVCCRAEWRDAFLAVPRHEFLPDTVWRADQIDRADQVDKETAERNDLVPLRRADDPDAWWALAYGDNFVITQADDGQPVGHDGTGFDITSSASMP